MLNAALLALLLAPQTTAAGDAGLKVVVATPVYQPDGNVSVETATLSAGAPNVVHMYGRRSLCDTATTGAPEPADAGFGWRVTSHVVSATASELVVSIDWQRLWDRGQRLANGPSGTVQLKLHPGDRIPLDHIPNPLATDACRAVGMGLEVKLARTASPGPPDRTLLPLGASAGGGPLLDADLWLLHTLPPGTQQVQHQKVRLSANGASFGFAPVTLTTPQGDVLVEFTGSFQRFRAPTGGEFLQVAMDRNVTGGPMPPAGGFKTSTGTVIALPGPTEVLSLELSGPGRARSGGGGGAGGRGGFGGARSAGGGARGTGGAGQPGTTRSGGGGGVGAGSIETATSAIQVMSVLAGHAFSLRVRMTPVPGS